MRPFPAVIVLGFASLLPTRPARGVDSVAGPATAPPTSSAPAGPAVERPSIAGRRIVKHFDFNEAPLGNYESLPMQWRRHGGAGFPLFLEGRFDRTVGHEQPPSFRLDLDGGSVGYHYQGADISVRTNSDYLIVAWVRTDSLRSARAYLTGCFLDRKGAVIPGTLRRSSMVGGTPDQSQWQAVTLGLPGGVPNSRYVGVSVWLAQAGMWSRTSPPPHTIQREDVRGTAWFDDITVYRLPRVSLASSHPGNVFRHDEPVELRTEVTDPDGLNLSATLVIHDAEDRQVSRRAVGIQSDQHAGGERHLYPELPVGLYEARLLITTGPTLLVRRELRFARLPDAVNPDQIRGRQFGIVLDQVDAGIHAAQRELLGHLRPAYVKLPIWSPQGQAADVAVLDDYLRAIVDAGAEPVGVLWDDRSAAETPGPATRPHATPGLVDLFLQDPLSWKPLIASTWARYAGLVSLWQLGLDGDDAIAADGRLDAALAALRREMSSLMGRPRLVTTGSVHDQAPTTRPADYHSRSVPHQVPVEDIAPHLLTATAPARGWTLIEPLPETFSRRMRLCDFARRLAEALFAGRNGVFIQAPWDVHPDPLRPRLDPREDLIIFRTVSDVLGEAVPVSRLTLDGQVRCLLFDRNGRGTMLVWDPDAPPEGREHFLPLGPEAHVVDLWGHRRPIESIGRQQRLTVGPEPVFVLNTSTWLMEFLRQFQMEPATIEFSYDVYEREITFRNTYHETIAGMLRLVGPPDWDIRPGKLLFSIAPGQTFRQPVSIRFPVNAQAGLLPLVGEFVIDADRRYHFNASTWFELALRDIDLETYTYRAGDRLIVRQTLTNRTPSPVHFQGYLLAPGRPRIERTFANFEPGSSITKDFILENADQLSGRNIRIGLKETQGSRVWNRVLTVP